ncbi:TetR/AcrR family transcriptional regulator [Patulibacter defluvii]|uniref:TetR/AcrR family transcriptional regulator n=1 Tax=Patulibacter defluvii TaxID=3095358 RepID=UPI002A74BFC2|nr:TetR/AcrR family transcriptional regulator [Patulibacter sp. DM4]
MIDEIVSATPEQRTTRAQQRAATRDAIVRATADCLVEEGYGELTTRRVAQRAGVAQSTVMHHFATREALLVVAVEHLAARLAADVFARVDLAALRTPAHRAAVLDEAWKEFTSPASLAAAQVWAAVWAEPELAPTLRELETRVTVIIFDAASALFPELADDDRLPALIDSSVALIRGLAAAIPIWGSDAVTARWQAIKPLLLEAAAHLLDG